MKDLNILNTPSSPRRSKPTSQTAHVSTAETRAWVADSFASRQQRLDAEDMLTTEQAADYVGTSRVTINAWIAKGRAIGLTQAKRGFKLPKWQFEPAIWGCMAELSKALRTTEGWALLSFLESPHGALDGVTPRQALERGQQIKVLEIAANEGH